MIDRRESFALIIGAATAPLVDHDAKAHTGAQPARSNATPIVEASQIPFAKPDNANSIRFTQAGADVAVRTLQDKARETVSVQDFGAVGDGVADDTLAIRKALASGADAIFLPRGVYIVSSANGRNIHLYGLGTLKKKAGTKGVLLNLTGDNRIEGITLDYDWKNAAQTLPYSDNISLQQVGGTLTLNGVIFRRSFTSALFVSGASLSTDMSCSFTEGAPHNGLSSGKERVTYYITCIAANDTRDQTICINGGYFRGASLDPERLHLNPTGIFITASAVDGVRFKTINISNPVLIGCSTNVGAGNVTGAIDIYNGAENIIITGATIRYFTYAGIKVQNSSRFSISGNMITDGKVPSRAFNAHAVGIATTEKNRSSTVEQRFGQISGNIVEECHYAGILNNCDWVTISSNILNRVVRAETGAGMMNDGNNVTIIGNAGTNIGGTFISSTGDHIKIVANNFDSGSDGRADGILFQGHDVAISDNSLVSGKASGGSGIRTNGPASNVRIGGNYAENFPYGVDLRTTGGAVKEVVISPSQFAGIQNANYNISKDAEHVARVVTEAW
ncbi:right-handed parallel beta-helix repeat-containing protein [Sphingopyxis sp. RIFCSPHIGHO2_12_FULL_65_19]|uniref:right-handed parallel beta-helix repeat-containing protein n=1 Tax=Sphingopyxis sp. RIFCSPHIGHO2_12_FULL_65_19 TaxID=1802172 RepID=UPI0008B6AC5D|nr:right-handed parallel beta-helix repeat-containing protein [Sphingopyxis sp. RIFCSPHIGHO2_12_FULL_65_19]OHD07536.1 MAG: hypothetical protein A3E77_09120 [Sphingopyxis sp. RIFCSPHIGHO2_12_FULL_65_19]